MGSRALRYLNAAQTIEVETDDAGRPARLTLNGRRHRVDSIREEWLVEDQWWTEEPVARHCFDAALADGRRIVFWKDLDSPGDATPHGGHWRWVRPAGHPRKHMT